ncbi:MAG: substrate-binding domain-containing protein [Pseudomonadota bacterium]
MNKGIFAGIIMLVLAGFAGDAGVAQERVTLVTTTSAYDSGLLDYLLEEFHQISPYRVRMLVYGTGQALAIARRGEADVLLTHHRPSEDAFVANGFGEKRYDVMHNDFVIIGPKDDPADIKGAQSYRDVLRRIHDTQSLFISRGDDSGAHKREIWLWQMAGFTPQELTPKWYRQIGNGMGAVINHANAVLGYSLSDRGTWLGAKNRADLAILYENDPVLHNPYSIIVLNLERFPHINYEGAQAFITWILSPPGQARIASYRLHGQQLFFPKNTP